MKGMDLGVGVLGLGFELGFGFRFGFELGFGFRFGFDLGFGFEFRFVLGFSGRNYFFFYF